MPRNLIHFATHKSRAFFAPAPRLHTAEKVLVNAQLLPLDKERRSRLNNEARERGAIDEQTQRNAIISALISHSSIGAKSL